MGAVCARCSAVNAKNAVACGMCGERFPAWGPPPPVAASRHDGFALFFGIACLFGSGASVAFLLVYVLGLSEIFDVPFFGAFAQMFSFVAVAVLLPFAIASGIAGAWFLSLARPRSPPPNP